MNTLHKRLHLQHHRHTGKLLHHRHTSYRGLAIVLGIASLFVVGLHVAARATADDLFVYATVPAPIPTSAAVITSPQEGATVRQSNLTVSGTCPVITPRVIITITDNGRVAGSASCSDSYTFAVPITIDPGDHTLLAKTYTITGDSGPDSAPVHIRYVRTVSTGPAGTPTGTGTQTDPLSIIADSPFIVYGPAKDAVWTGTISGGKPPYKVHIDWGDGTTNDYSIGLGRQSFRHHYRRVLDYDVTLTVTDQAGNSLTEHYAAVSPYAAPGSATSGNTPLPGAIHGFINWLGGIWLFWLYIWYLLLLLLLVLLWLRSQRSHRFAYAKVPPARRKASSSSRRYVAAKKRKRKKDKAR